MTKKLFKVPFTYTLTALALVVAETADAAIDNVAERHVFDETNIDESNVFWEEGAMILSSSVKKDDPAILEAIEVKDELEIKDLCESYEIDLNAKDEDEDESLDDNGMDFVDSDEESNNLDAAEHDRLEAEKK